VLVVEVDHVHAQPLEAGLAGLDDVIRAAVDEVGPAGVLHLAELRRQHDVIAPAGERLADQRLVVAPAVHVRGVDVVDAEVDRLVDERDRFRVVGGAVDSR
jgi:hypothetical protein